MFCEFSYDEIHDKNDKSQVDRQAGTKRAYNLIAGVGVDAAIREHIKSLLQLVEMHNNFSNKPLTVHDVLLVWRDDIALKPGSSRIEAEKLDPAVNFEVGSGPPPYRGPSR